MKCIYLFMLIVMLNIVSASTNIVSASTKEESDVVILFNIIKNAFTNSNVSTKKDKIEEEKVSLEEKVVMLYDILKSAFHDSDAPAKLKKEKIQEEKVSMKEKVFMLYDIFTGAFHDSTKEAKEAKIKQEENKEVAAGLFPQKISIISSKISDTENINGDYELKKLIKTHEDQEVPEVVLYYINKDHTLKWDGMTYAWQVYINHQKFSGYGIKHDRTKNMRYPYSPIEIKTWCFQIPKTHDHFHSIKKSFPAAEVISVTVEEEDKFM